MTKRHALIVLLTWFTLYSAQLAITRYLHPSVCLVFSTIASRDLRGNEYRPCLIAARKP